jgi:predicted aspartyl protease
MTVFLRGVIDQRMPLVSDFYVVGEAEDIPVTAILDTGFTGMVVLPRSLQALAPFVHYGFERYELADGQVINTELFKGRIRIGKHALDAVISFADTEVGTLGMELIEGKRAIFDVKRHIFRVLD